MIRLTSPFAVALALVAALGFAAPGALAQQSEAPSINAEDLSSEKLDAFVQAANAIQSVMDDYRPQMESAESDADRQALRKEVNDEIIAAVKAVPGISIDEYVQIAKAARGNEDLRNRIRDRMSQS